jgi:general secretion pathway protein F
LTQLLLGTGVFLKNFGWVIPLFFLAAFVIGRKLYQNPRARSWVDQLLLRLFFVKKIILYSELTRLCRTLGTMMQAGVPLLRALNLVEQLIMNTALQKAIAPIHGEIKVGRPVSNFFRSNPLFPIRMGTMLRIAEEQGNLGEGLLSLGDYFENELQRSLQRMMTLLEPVIIIATGGAIGLMVLSMFSAIFGITDIQF